MLDRTTAARHRIGLDSWSRLAPDACCSGCSASRTWMPTPRCAAIPRSCATSETAIRSPAPKPGGTWLWCWATGNCAASACGPSRNARPASWPAGSAAGSRRAGPACEVGWTLRREFWGSGYATEAAQTVLADAFTRLGHCALISLIHPENERSIAVALRLGMRREQETEVMGHPVLIYGIDRTSQTTRFEHDRRSSGRRRSVPVVDCRKTRTISPNSVYPSRLGLDYTNPRLETE